MNGFRVENYTPPGLRFLDLVSGREMILVNGGEWDGWLVRAHPDGGWTSLCKATEKDRDAIRRARQHGGGKVAYTKPCPCCGSDNLYMGVMSTSTQGVKCEACNLEMTRSYPDEWPDEVESGNLDALQEWTLIQAVRAWNRRTGGKTDGEDKGGTAAAPDGP